uniref:Uncharacterized protein n=1 Tax=Arundo donax TaxID=35708 RepID=A0A0A9DZU8_ARUDO
MNKNDVQQSLHRQSITCPVTMHMHHMLNLFSEIRSLEHVKKTKLAARGRPTHRVEVILYMRDSICLYSALTLICI